MREIKFRAWDKQENKMWTYEDDTNQVGFCIDSVHNTISVIDLENDNRLEIAVEIMQYTGLKDKNGKEIYEGDIVRFTNEIDEIFNEEVGTIIFEQSECNFCIQRTVINPENYPVPKTINTIYLIDNAQYNAVYEVIGNIYENPTLISE